jgi:hypothetical protein
LDTLFFHSWPDEINEGLQTQWATLPFTGASGPLAFIYKGNTWQDYSVKIQMHSSNPILTTLAGKAVGSTGGQNIFSIAGAANAILDVIRVQMQVAWCKSICLPNNDKFIAQAQAIIDSLTGAKDDFDRFIDEFAKGIKGVASTLSTSISDLQELGPYAGSLFPPLITTNYGYFLKLYGFCNSVNIRWLPPFVPLVGFPHRAEVTLNFQRFFPFAKTPTRNQARGQLGRMG